MANKPKTGMIFPRGARRQSMLQVGDVTDLGTIIQIRKKTKKYGRHYLVDQPYTGRPMWFHRHQLEVK